MNQKLELIQEQIKYLFYKIIGKPKMYSICFSLNKPKRSPDDVATLLEDIFSDNGLEMIDTAKGIRDLLTIWYPAIEFESEGIGNVKLGYEKIEIRMTGDINRVDSIFITVETYEKPTETVELVNKLMKRFGLYGLIIGKNPWVIPV